MLPHGSDYSQVGIEPPKEPDPRESWMRAHPQTAALGGAIALVVIGALIVMSRSAVAPAARPEAWSGSDAPLLSPVSYDTGGQRDAPPLQTGPYGGTTTKQVPVYRPPDTAAKTVADTFDLGEFLTELTRPISTRTEGGDDDTAIRYAESFIPRGLISTSSFTKARTESQQKLYDYGNDVGSYIQSYEEANRNAPQVLTDQLQDRQNPQKAQAVRNIGRALKNVGISMQGMDEVPAMAKSAHDALAASYVQIGENLSKVPDSDGDKQLLAAIDTYNKSAEQFAKRYAALALIFAAASVTFAPEDAGSVFSFTASGGF